MVMEDNVALEKNKQIDLWNRTEYPEIGHTNLVNWFTLLSKLNKGAMAIQWRKDSHFNK